MESITDSLDHTLGLQLARHLREVHLGGNWCENNYRDIMQDLSVVEINDSSNSSNSILKLCYHTHYYVKVLGCVLAGEPLNSSDADSFLHPQISTQDELKAFEKLIIETAEATALQLEKTDAKQLSLFFGSEKYGSIFRNTLGIIEHLNYHLGQLVLLKKQLRTKNLVSKY